MKSQTQKTTIITGATGLLGSHLLYELSKKEDNIIALKRPASSLSLTEKIFKWQENNSKTNFKKINWVEADITDIDSLLKIFEKDSKVYHAAGKVSFDEKDKNQLFEVNVNGTGNVVNAAIEKGVSKLCFVSSIAAIGRSSNNTPTSEETPWDNNAKISLYAESKYEAEREIWRGIAEGLSSVIVNPSIILGPGNWNESSARLFSNVYNGLKFYTKGTNGYVAADDLAKIMIALMESDAESQRFIINSENITYQQLFTWIAESLHVKPPKYLAGPILSETVWRILKLVSLFTGKTPLITRETAQTANSNYYYSNEKIILQTGFHFKPIKETIKETAEFFLQDLNRVT